MKTRLTLSARRQADGIDRWWRANRPAAADLFTREFVEARTTIGQTPEIGAVYVERQKTAVRRVLLPKTKNHVYYESDAEKALVTILAVWGAPKGRDPNL